MALTKQEAGTDPPQEPTTLTDKAYLALRNDIINSGFQPKEALRVDRLKSRYGVGLSPLREALSRLSVEGLVTWEPQRGFRVSPVSHADLIDITERRVQLETEALRRSIERGDEEWAARIVSTHYRLSMVEDRLKDSDRGIDPKEWEQRNSDFHNALISACGSPWLLRFCSLLYYQSERYRRLSFAKVAKSRNVRLEHKRIMDATLARDAKKACAALQDHIEKTAGIVAGVIDA